MPTPTITFGSDLAIAGTYRIYLRQRWDDEWVENTKIKLETVTWTANPSVPTASLSYQYGPALERGTSTPSLRTRLSIEGWFVKLSVDCPESTTREWVGYVDAIGESDQGVVTYDGSPRATGKQSFACLGIINVLQYVSTEQSFVEVNNTTPQSVQRCLSACVFNQIDGDIERADKTRIDRMLKTRQVDKSSGESSYAHIFDKIYGRNNNGSVTYNAWSTKDIAEHLLDKYAPLDSDDEQTIIFKWADDLLTRLPDADTPYLDTSGKSLLDCLNELLSAARLLGYYASVNEDNEVELTTFTYADADVVTDDYTITANANQVNLAMMVDPATSYAVQTNLSSMYNRVRVRGDYRRTVFTGLCRVSAFDTNGTLIPGWDSEMLTRRNDKQTAIEADSSNAGAPRIEKILQLYDSPEFFPVMGAWRLKTDQAPDVGIKIGDELLFPNEDEQPYYPFPTNLVVTPQLPLLKGRDYTAGFSDNSKAVTPREWMEMQVFTPQYIKDESTFAITTHATNRVYWGDRHKRPYMWDPIEPNFSLQAKPLENAVGVQLIVNGASQYQLLNGTTQLSSYYVQHHPAINVNDIRVTMCIREDRRIEKISPETTTGLDAVRELVINVPNLQNIRILKDTLLYTGNQVYTVPSTTTIRDDSQKLNSIAERAAAWFTTPRRVVRISSKRTTSQLDIGYLIDKIEPTTAQEQTIKTVVTQLSMSFSGRAPSMEIETQSGQLDAMAFTPPEWKTQ